MNFEFDPSDEALRQDVRAFLAERLPKDWVGIFREGDASDVSFRLCREMAARGWLTMHWPAEYGGHGASAWTQVVLQQELWAHHEPRGGQYMGLNWVGPAIMRFGTEDQRRVFLPRIAAGEMQWAQLFSEPGAGSDLASLQTSALVRDDDFVVNGEKIWISYGDIAHYGFLVTRSTPGSRRRDGLSVLLVDMETPGVEVRTIRTPLGTHRLHQVSFRDAIVPRSALLGPLDHGWEVATTALSFERSGTARYARSTRMLGLLERLPDGAGPEYEERFAEALAFGRAAELINHKVVAIKEEGGVPAWEASTARIYNALYENHVASLAKRMVGPLALVEADDPNSLERGEIETFVRSAPTATITAGTYEIQMGIVAQRGLGIERRK
ncbi:MAG: acyl-CoA dehydrogenase family protein [Actinomycetota bacterium]